jgi:hypothetical protein
MSDLNLPDLPKHHFWRIKRNRDSDYYPVLVQLRRTWLGGLFSTVVAADSSNQRSIATVARNLTEVVRASTEERALHGDYGRTKR